MTSVCGHVLLTNASAWAFLGAPTFLLLILAILFVHGAQTGILLGVHRDHHPRLFGLVQAMCALLIVFLALLIWLVWNLPGCA